MWIGLEHHDPQNILSSIYNFPLVPFLLIPWIIGFLTIPSAASSNNPWVSDAGMALEGIPGVPGIASLLTGLRGARGLPGVLVEREDGAGEPEEDMEVDDISPETRRGREIGKGNILLLLVTVTATGVVGIVGVIVGFSKKALC